MKLRKISTLLGIIGTTMLLTACVPQVPGLPTPPIPTTSTSTTTTTTTTTTPEPVIQNGSAQVLCGESSGSLPLPEKEYFAINTTKSGDVLLTLSTKPNYHGTFDNLNDGVLFNKIAEAQVGVPKAIAKSSSDTTWFTLIYNYEYEYLNAGYTQLVETEIIFEVRMEGNRISVKSNLGSRAYAATNFESLSSVTIGHFSTEDFLAAEKYTGTDTLEPDTLLGDPTFERPFGWGYSGDQIGISSNPTPPVGPVENSASIFDRIAIDEKQTRFGCVASASLS